MKRNRRVGKSKNRNKGRRRAREAQTITMPARYGVTFTYSAATTQNEISLAIGTATGFPSTSRIYDIAQGFAEFRVVELHATIYPYTDSTTGDQIMAMAYLPSTDSAAAADTFTFANLQNVSALALCPARKTVPTTLSVGRSYLLATIQKWYPTQAAGDTKNDVQQGTIIIKPRASATCDVVVELSLLIQFKIPTLDVLAGRVYRPKSENKEEITAKEEILSDSEEYAIIKRYKIKRADLTAITPPKSKCDN